MSAVPVPAASRLLLSGNEAVARAVWESGCRVAAAYPGTPSTEMLEAISTYPDIYSEWSVNEKVSLEVTIGAAFAGSRSFCAMKHVGMNVASDALMTLTLTGVVGGLVIAIADDVGLSSSQNEQDSRFWGRFAHLPIFEPADSQEAYEMTKLAFDFSEKHQVPVILRMTTRINHVKGLVTVGERAAHAASGFKKEPARWVMTPAGAGKRIPLMFERDKALRAEAEASPLNVVEAGSAGTGSPSSFAIAGRSTLGDSSPWRGRISLPTHSMPAALSSVSISGSTSSTTRSRSTPAAKARTLSVGTGQEKPSLSTGAAGKASRTCM